ncbi:hypothetical protein [Candidatus Halobonum tyrrellensis]|nr:hypothetical protein [Candidatus Halobonum tyrrellensis]
MDQTSRYASVNDNGLLTLEFNGNGTGGSGLNMDAVSTFPGVFEMVNNGPNNLDITIDKEGLAYPDRWQFVSKEEYEEYSGNYPEDNWYPSWDEYGGYESTNASGGGLASGNSTQVSVMIDTRGITDETLDIGGTIRIAVTDVDGPYGSNSGSS